MNQQGARRGHEDDWWRQLYGDGDGGRDGGADGGRAGGGAREGGTRHGGARDAGPSDVSDTLDDRVESVLRAVGPATVVRREEAAEPGEPGEDVAGPGEGAAGSVAEAPEASLVELLPPSAGASAGPSAPPAASAVPAEPSVVLPEPVPSASPPVPPEPVPSAPSAGIPLQATEPGPGPGPHPMPLPSAPPSPPSSPPSQLSPPATSASPPCAPLAVDYVGDRPPTYDPEPVALPAADPAALDELVPDTALEGARYGSLTLRAASLRGDSARYRGEPRRDALLTARFGTGRHTLILVALATGAPIGERAHLAARDACAWIGGAVGRGHTRLAEDIRTDNRGALKAGLQRLTARTYGRLRGRAAELGAEPEEYTAALRCLLLPADPECRTRVFFGVGEGGLFRLRDDAWQDLEPTPPGRDAVTGPGHEPVAGPGGAPQSGSERTPPDDGPRTAPDPGHGAGPSGNGPDGPPAGLRHAVVPGPADPQPAADPAPTAPGPAASPPTPGLAIPAPAPAPGHSVPDRPQTPETAENGAQPAPFLFQVLATRPGDALLLCSAGLAEPLTEEPEFADRLAAQWSRAEPPGLVAFLAAAQLRVKGHARDRTAVAVWET
ncbi:protein phosphatase 2C domain-containing protein [Streptomyces celluloflavus]|uniref:protein phosphatase 2C domain-containing protein n=1 Tax=Streptomyces celluloflavus TaxID=58344 RepID=UPI0037B4DE16